MSATLLEVRGLTKRFGGLTANEDVDFTLGAGEILGLIGPNGAGKTTVFNSLAGFFPPTSGTILLDGASIEGLPPEAVAARGVARTFQIVRIFRSMTVMENVMVGAMLRHRAVPEAARVARETLDFTGLSRRAHDPAGQLTVAEQKRLELTRALATGPRLLLLDEVMAGLTASEVQEAVELVKRIRDRGIACVVVEHVMEGIMPIADRMVVLENGRKIAEGPPAAIAVDPVVIRAYLGEGYLLRVRDVRISYGRVPAVHGVSLEVAAGTIAAVVGANGAGKSTVLRAVAGLNRIDSGSIELDGRPIQGIPAHRRVPLGLSLVPEGRHLFPRLTVRRNLELGAFTRRDAREVRESLDLVLETFPFLKDRQEQQAGTLSGGEQQMLAIGRGLMSRPRLLLLDEPSWGVAPMLVARIFETILAINRTGVAVLLVEQNVQRALSIAHRATVIQTGRVVAEGSAAELLGSDLVRKAYLGL